MKNSREKCSEESEVRSEMRKKEKMQSDNVKSQSRARESGEKWREKLQMRDGLESKEKRESDIEWESEERK